MPRPVLRIVAAVLVLAAAGSFALGVAHAPDRGRLPGEPAPGSRAAPASVIDAPEATPLAQDRIEGPPKTVEKPATNTQSDDDEATNATDESATNATTPGRAPASASSALNATNTTAPTLGEATNTTAPSTDEEPPH